MEQKGKFDYEELKRKTLEQLRSDKSLFGKDGAFAPLLKDILEAALEGEMEVHLDDEERANGNRTVKTVNSLKRQMVLLSWRHLMTGQAALSRRLSKSGRRSWPKALRAKLSACMV